MSSSRSCPAGTANHRYPHLRCRLLRLRPRPGRARTRQRRCTRPAARRGPMAWLPGTSPHAPMACRILSRPGRRLPGERLGRLPSPAAPLLRRISNVRATTPRAPGAAPSATTSAAAAHRPRGAKAAARPVLGSHLSRPRPVRPDERVSPGTGPGPGSVQGLSGGSCRTGPGPRRAQRLSVKVKSPESLPLSRTAATSFPSVMSLSTSARDRPQPSATSRTGRTGIRAAKRTETSITSRSR